jgi:hypothetical protein
MIRQPLKKGVANSYPTCSRVGEMWLEHRCKELLCYQSQAAPSLTYESALAHPFSLSTLQLPATEILILPEGLNWLPPLVAQPSAEVVPNLFPAFQQPRGSERDRVRRGRENQAPLVLREPPLKSHCFPYPKVNQPPPPLS